MTFPACQTLTIVCSVEMSEFLIHPKQLPLPDIYTVFLNGYSCLLSIVVAPTAVVTGKSCNHSLHIISYSRATLLCHAYFCAIVYIHSELFIWSVITLCRCVCVGWGGGGYVLSTMHSEYFVIILDLKNRYTASVQVSKSGEESVVRATTRRKWAIARVVR